MTNLSTNGTLTAGVSTLSSGSEIGDLTCQMGPSPHLLMQLILGMMLVHTGTLSTGTATLGFNSRQLALTDGSITSSSDAIDFE